MMSDLFDSRDMASRDRTPRILAEGAVHLPGFASELETALLAHVERISHEAPFRHLETPGGGRMSVEMTNCGEVGWYSDRKGYRYVAEDPCTLRAWPKMPVMFLDLARGAAEAAGYEDFRPRGCLVNRYEPGARMGLHQDKDEVPLTAPVVSVSLGARAVFSFGGLSRSDPAQRVELLGGDVVVWGGASRLAFHGVSAPKGPGFGDFVRYNLTFREARAGRR